MATANPRVLFLCAHNAARSQMAEVLLRRHGGLRFEACSAGLDPTTIHPLTRRVLTEVDLDTSGLRAKGIGEFLGKVTVRYAIVVCELAQRTCPRLFPFARTTLYWPFDDPAETAGSVDEQLAVFRSVRDKIETRVRQFLLTAFRSPRAGRVRLVDEFGHVARAIQEKRRTAQFPTESARKSLVPLHRGFDRFRRRLEQG